MMKRLYILGVLALVMMLAALMACGSDSKKTVGPGPDDSVSVFDTLLAYHRTVTLAALDPASTDSLVQYPLLLRLVAGADSTGGDALAGAGADGARLRFYTPDSTVLPHEIESWSTTEAAIWVRVPKVMLNTATTLHMAWGDTVPAGATGSVFDTANGFAAVFHLAEAAGDTVRDRTANGYKGVPVVGITAGSTAPTDVAGPVGRAKAFGGTADTAAVGAQTGGAYRLETETGGNTYNSFDYAGLDAEFTVSLWVNYSAYPPDFPRRRGILTKADHGVNQFDDNDPLAQWFLRPNIEARVLHFGRVAQQNYSTQPYSIADGNGPIAGVLGNWNYVTYAARGVTADNAFRLYNDAGSTFRDIADEAGVHRDVDVFIGGFASNSGVGGEKSGGTNFLNGMIDEVRISKQARPNAWHNLDFATQRPGSQAVKLGTTATATVIVPISD